MGKHKEHRSRRPPEDHEPGRLDITMGEHNDSKLKRVGAWARSKKPSLPKPRQVFDERHEKSASTAPQLDVNVSRSSTTSSYYGTRSPAVHLPRFDRSSTHAGQMDDAARMNEAIMGLGPRGGRRSLDSMNPPRSKLDHGETTMIGATRERHGESNDLRNVEIILLKAGYEFTELQQPDQEETVVEAARRFINQYRTIVVDLHKAHHNLEAANHLVNEHNTLKTRFQEMEYELHSIKNAWRTSNSELDAKKKELFYAVQKTSELSAAYEKEKNALKDVINRMNYDHEVALNAEKAFLAQEKERLRNVCEEQVREARADEAQHQKDTVRGLMKERETRHREWVAHVEVVKNELEAELREAEIRFNDAKIGYEADLRNAKGKFKAEKREQDDNHHRQLQHEENKLRQATIDHETQVGKLMFDVEEEKSRLRQEIQALQVKVEMEQERRKKDLAKQKAVLNLKHKEDTYQLQTQYEDVKLGLFERKHFKGLRDRDVTGQFSAIVGQVRDFANLDWDVQREAEWPFGDDQLLDIHGHNIRKLKKQLLQNSLWIILYNFVFRTPFRILGTEGRELDSDWIHIHTPNTSSLEWPEIPAEVEKRRFETANAFLAVIDPSVKASGNDIRLKASYEGAVANTLETLYRALSKVASLEPRHRKILENLVRLCAKTWMQFCSQPYRLIVTLPSGSGDLLSSPQRNERSLTLVISPELKRYGDSQGQNLTRGEVVPDCQAAVQAYPAR